MKKHLISVSIVLALVFCLLSPLTALAEPRKVAALDFTYTGYIPGGALPTVSVDKDADYRVEDISYMFFKNETAVCYGIGDTWLLLDSSGAPISSQKTMPDVSACDCMIAIIDFHTKEKSIIFDEAVTVTANGGELPESDSAELEKGGCNGWYLDDDDALFSIISFGIPTLPAIDTVAVTVPTDIAGKTADSIAKQIKIPANTTLEKIEFRDDNNDPIEGALPKNAKKANLYIVLKAKEGYRFASIPSSANFNVWNGKSATVNGKDASKVSLGNERSKKGGVSNSSAVGPDAIIYMSIRATVQPVTEPGRSPKTGDNGLLPLLTLLAVMSLAGIGVSASALKKA